MRGWNLTPNIDLSCVAYDGQRDRAAANATTLATRRSSSGVLRDRANGAVIPSCPSIECRAQPPRATMRGGTSDRPMAPTSAPVSFACLCRFRSRRPCPPPHWRCLESAWSAGAEDDQGDPPESGRSTRFFRRRNRGNYACRFRFRQTSRLGLTSIHGRQYRTPMDIFFDGW
jgi:hypothetical protein